MLNLNEDLKGMIEVGNIAAKFLEYINKFIIPGINTNYINEIFNLYLQKNNCKSAILGYMGYEKSICTSINDVVCHGVPNNKDILKSGDIINIDVSIVKDGYYSDTSKMFKIGNVSELSKKICYVTKKCLYSSIKILKPGKKISIIGKKIQNIANNNNFSVVKDYCGHGIGKKLHDYPNVLHYYSKEQDKILLNPGMAITIEPMINVGSYKTKLEKDGWTVKTLDGSLSAQYEHTIIITNKGYIVTTIRNNELF